MVPSNRQGRRLTPPLQRTPDAPAVAGHMGDPVFERRRWPFIGAAERQQRRRPILEFRTCLFES